MTFTVNTTPSYYYPAVYFKASSGTAYVDAIQLEAGNLGSYNLVQNGSFTNGKNYWTTPSSVTVSQNSSTSKYELNMTGNHNSDITATQRINLKLPVTTTYMLTAWARANSADTDVHPSSTHDIEQKIRSFAVKTTISYKNAAGTVISTKTETTADFNCNTDQSQYMFMPIVPRSADYANAAQQTYIDIEISYNQNVNTASSLIYH